MSEINPSAIALADVLRANPGKPLTFAEIADMAGVDPKKTGLIRTMKGILGAENLVIGKTEVHKPHMRKIGLYSYVKNEEFVPSEKSNPSAGSKAVAEYLLAHEGEEHSLAEIAAVLGLEAKPMSGYLAGAKAILGKANIVKVDKEIEADSVSEVNTYTFNA